MKLYFNLMLVLFLLFIKFTNGQLKPFGNFEQLLLEVEQNPKIQLNAKQEAIKKGLPVSIFLPNKALIEAASIENGKPVYTIKKNFLHPLKDGELAFYEEIESVFDLNKAKINYGNGKIVDNSNYKIILPKNKPNKVLMVPDWTYDRVMAFDINTGDLVDTAWVHSNGPNLQSPKQALLNSRGFISVADQISDLVQKYDTSGNYIGFLAPAGGVNNTQLDNCRGHNYRANGNLVVTIGSGGNQNAVAEFDTGGNYIGQFIAASSGGLSSPFDIIFRTNDVLVTGSSSDAVHKYQLNGTYISDLITGVNFPQQVLELPNGNIIVAVFSTPSGLGVYSSTGTQLQFLTGVTGNRSGWRLPNGNYLTTNGTGIHEVDDTTGNLVRTIFLGSNLQYINLYDYTSIPVELTSFNVNINGGIVNLIWSTATETNNKGFEIQRAEVKNHNEVFNWGTIGFVNGKGTTVEKQHYSFNDRSEKAGKYSYRLKQIDFDGTFKYSKEIEVDLIAINNFSLEQNYPNPFFANGDANASGNQKTSIAYFIPNESNVKIEISNSLGEVVSILFDGKENSGKHVKYFSPNNLPSGIYFYTVSTDFGKATRKMLLMR